MKITWKENLVMILAVLAVLVIMTGCEYDAPTAMYYQDQATYLTPVISEIIPADVAPAGANTITIRGTDLKSDSGSVSVYFDNVMAEMLNATSTELLVRRPNLVSDAAVVKVVSDASLVVVRQENYKIESVIESYGGFLDGERHSVLAVDNDENLYVIQRSPRTVYRIPADGSDKVVIGEASKIATDAKMGPNGKLLILMNNKSIMQMDVTTGEETEWVAVAKKVSFGDFDANGNFFCAGKKTDLYVVHSDLSSTASGLYADHDVYCVRVFGDYVYVLGEDTKAGEGDPAIAIWRSKIADATGTLNDAELVLDWSTTGEYADYAPLYMVFDADGNLYVGSEAPSPLFMLTTQGTFDVMYKEIVPTTASILVWGNGNYLYQIMGGDEWDIKRIDMGKTSAPYYGRSL